MLRYHYTFPVYLDLPVRKEKNIALILVCMLCASLEEVIAC